MIPDSSREELLDVFSRSPEGLARDKVGDTQVKDYIVEGYDPVTHMAIAYPARVGGDPIELRVQTTHRGPLTGTGTAVGLHRGQLVRVVFVGGSSYGIFSTGEVAGTVFTPLDAAAPAYAPFQQDGTGVVTVMPGPDGGYGTAEHTSHSSKHSKTVFGESNVEDWGHQHVVSTGENTTRAEVELREAASAFKLAAAKLGLSIG